jgi:hypothetical protein
VKGILLVALFVICSLWVEVSVSSLGLALPILYFQLFYVTVVYKWRGALLTALVSCTVLDSLLGYYSLPGALVVIVLSSFWRNSGDCSRVGLQGFPAGFILFFALFLQIVCVYLLYGGLIQWWRWLVQFVSGVSLLALMTPILIHLQDWLAHKLEVKTFAGFQREELYSATNK